MCNSDMSKSMIKFHINFKGINSLGSVRVATMLVSEIPNLWQ